jgi:acyl carrier protein
VVTRETTRITREVSPIKGEESMSQEDVLAGLAEIVNEVAGIPAESVQMEKSFVDDLDVDSLSMVEVVMACEDKFGVTIPDTEVKNLNTVADAVNYITANK